MIKVNKFVYKIRVLRAFHGERLGIIGRKIDYSPDAHTGNESGEINVKRVTKKKKKKGVIYTTIILLYEQEAYGEFLII